MSIPDSLSNALQQYLQRLVDQNDAAIHNVAIDIRVPKQNWQVTLCAGEARPGYAMQAEQAVHWASIGKTLTAVLLFQAVDQGLLGSEGIETPLAAMGLLDMEVLAKLHPQAADIRLEHLLRHTSGLRDGMVDDAEHLAGDCDGLAPNSLVGLLFSGLDSPACQRWQAWDAERPDQAFAGTLNFFLANGLGSQPVGSPGERFHYSDTGYVILALVCEQLFGIPLHQLYQERVFEPLGIDDAYLAYRSDPPLGELRMPEAEVYAAKMPLLDSGFDLSFDWGGGGPVSSVASMNRVLLGLSTGELLSFGQLNAMQAWQTPPGLKQPRLAVGCGLFLTVGGDGKLWGHSGAWGGKMFSDADAGIYFAGTVNQVFAPPDWHRPLVDAVRQELNH